MDKNGCRDGVTCVVFVCPVLPGHCHVFHTCLHRRRKHGGSAGFRPQTLTVMGTLPHRLQETRGVMQLHPRAFVSCFKQPISLVVSLVVSNSLVNGLRETLLRLKHKYSAFVCSVR